MQHLASVLALLAIASAATACGSSPTAPDAGSSAGLRMYLASSPAGPWSLQTISVTGHDARGLVDASPILMPDGRILMYYLMSYQSDGDPARSQPNNQWKIGVAESTDNGQSFTHRAVAYTGPSSTTDPFPLALGSGLIRLYLSPGGPGVMSVTSTDSSGFNFSPTLDTGMRVTFGSVPGALKVGATYYLYAHSNNSISYYTSADGLTFSQGHATGLSGGSPSPISAGDGTYLMSYICQGQGASTDPRTHESCMATSPDGKVWTQASRIGLGSVPGLVKSTDGMLRVYVTS